MAEALLASPLVGRRRPLESLQRWVTELAAGRGRAVLVEGEPGIGKSSLVRAATTEAKAAGCKVLWAACDELSQAFPLVPLLDASQGGHGHPAIMEMLRANAPHDNGIDVVSAATERLLALVDEACAAAPVMLVVDDLQWADPATVLALGRMARSVRQLPLLVVGVTRPVPHREDLSALRRTVEPAELLRLHSLTDAEVAELVERAVGGTPGPRLLRLAADAAGNPLYLTELIDALGRGRALTVNDGCVEASNDWTPGSLASAIADRLEFLPTQVRGVLRAAALLGVNFAVSELALIYNRRVSDLLPILDEAVLAGMLRDEGRDLAFRHPLIQRALYEGMPAGVRAAWHLDAGKALARHGVPTERVARQLLAALGGAVGTGAADEWVVDWLVEVGQQLISQAPNAAISLLRWAVTDLPVGDDRQDLLTCRLAGALLRVGDVAGATHVATTALAHVTRPDVIVDLHWTLTGCRARDGRFEESLVQLEHALKAPKLNAQHRARLLILIARIHRSLGRVDTASRIAEAAHAEATVTGDRWAASWALGVLALIHGMRGESKQALPFFERALAEAEGDPGLADLRLVLHLNLATALGVLNRYDEAIEAAGQARRLADDAGNVVRFTQAQTVLCELLFDVGRWDEALAEIDVESDWSRDPATVCSEHGIAATIYLHRGEEAASAHLAEAERHAARLGDRVFTSLMLGRSLALEQADAPAEALAALVGGLLDTEDVDETADILADAVRLAIAIGDDTTAKTVAGRAETLARGSDMPHRQAVAAHCRGLLDGDPALLLQAAELYKTAGRPLPRAQALEAAGIALADRGDVSGARTHFTTAYAVYTDLAARWDQARTQAIFRKYGIRRGPQVRHRRSQHGWDSLTPTELKVVELVAKGMSNPDIAAHLFLSRRTVQTHVSHILTKLNLHSRIDIAREASRRGES